METVHILNPAAGQGGALKFSSLDNVYITNGVGDATKYVENTLKESGAVNFAVYGGDGTVNEVVTGILNSGVKDATVTVVPTGTGNDLVRTVKEIPGDAVLADVLTINDKYSVNAINTGFDLSVVLKAAEFKKKPMVSGSLAYIMGIAATLCGKFGRKINVKYTDENGVVEEFDDECLLAVAANAKYYGGGFKSAPAADISDGLIDLLIVKKVSRAKFLMLVSAYQKGLHIDTVKEKVVSKFSDILIFKKCKEIIIEGIENICADGEVFGATTAKIGILPKAIKIVKAR